MEPMTCHSKKKPNELLPNTRFAIEEDFRRSDGTFNSNKKYYYWCRGNQCYMPWKTQHLNTIKEMESQIWTLKKKIRLQQILVGI